MHIELNEEEFAQLLFTLGCALGSATVQQDKQQMLAVLRLANAINRHNPNWTNYEVPNEHVNVTGCGSSV
jgi:hypothetical protein